MSKPMSFSASRKLPKLDANGERVVPGWYMWDTWNALVKVTKRKGRLQICPPGGVHVAVTAALAGTLTPLTIAQEAWVKKVQLDAKGWTKENYAAALRALLEET